MTLIESEQLKDIHLTQIVRGPFYLRFAAYRKGEDAKLDLRSEDYIVSDLTPEQAIFVLCDGVGSSYYGNIGSQFLGETIRNWAGTVALPNVTDFGETKSQNLWLDMITEELKSELDSKIKLATNIIENRKFNDQGELIRLAEKTQRDDFGTQSNFAGGVIWPKSDIFPDGIVLLFWLGNARVRIFNELESDDLDGNKFEELTHLIKWGGDPEQLKEVWSSKEGVVGRICSYLTNLSKITTVIAYSDGMEGVEEKIAPKIGGVELEACIRQAQSIKDDDVSYLEIFLNKVDDDEYLDDIVSTIRSQYLKVDNSVVLAGPQYELQELKKKHDALEKKLKEQLLDFKKTKMRLIAMAGIFVMLAISFGLIVGYAIRIPSVVEVTPIVVISPTFTLIPALVTPSTLPLPVIQPPPITTILAVETATQPLQVITTPSMVTQSAPSSGTPAP